MEPDDQGRLVPPVRTTGRVPTRRRWLLALLPAPPRAYGWGRTRWSWATLALTWQTTGGLTVSAETLRRRLRELGWVGKRAKLVATEDDPPRVTRLARIRFVDAQVRLGAAIVLAAELARQLLPKVSAARMPTGTPRAVRTPGPQAKHYVAGALELATGTVPHGVGPRKTPALFWVLLQALDAADPAAQYRRIDVVVDHDKLHQAKAVAPGLATHPRFARLFAPTSCPRANPIERVVGAGHDLCPRHHTRQRVREVVVEVVEHRHGKGPWKYALSDIYREPAVTDAVATRVIEPTLATTSGVHQSGVDRFGSDPDGSIATGSTNARVESDAREEPSVPPTPNGECASGGNPLVAAIPPPSMATPTIRLQVLHATRRSSGIVCKSYNTASRPLASPPVAAILQGGP